MGDEAFFFIVTHEKPLRRIGFLALGDEVTMILRFVGKNLENPPPRCVMMGGGRYVVSSYITQKYRHRRHRRKKARCRIEKKVTMPIVTPSSPIVTEHKSFAFRYERLCTN